MLNLIKADLFRLFKSNSFRISIIGIFTFIGLITTEFLTTKQGLRVMSMYKDDVVYGFRFDLIKNSSSYEEVFMSAIGISIIVCIAMLFIIIDIIITKYNTGIMKTLISYGHSRLSIYASGIITSVAATFILMSIGVITEFITWKFIFRIKGRVDSEVMIQMGKVFFIATVSIIAVISFIQLFCILIRSKGVVGIISALSVTIVPIMLINTMPSEIRDLVPIYILMKMCGAFTISIDFVYYMQILLLGIGISMVLGYLIFSRQEVK